MMLLHVCHVQTVLLCRRRRCRRCCLRKLHMHITMTSSISYITLLHFILLARVLYARVCVDVAVRLSRCMIIYCVQQATTSTRDPGLVQQMLKITQMFEYVHAESTPLNMVPGPFFSTIDNAVVVVQSHIACFCCLNVCEFVRNANLHPD